MEPHDPFGYPPVRHYRNIVRRNPFRVCRCDGRLGTVSRIRVGFFRFFTFVRLFWRFQCILERAVGAQQRKIADGHCRIRDMEIRAFADGLFHPICEIAKCFCHTLARDGQDRPDAWLRDHHVNVLGLQPAKHDLFSGARLCRRMVQ
ncbi:MAG: hypothetical protein ACREFQ_11500 [Stellaceae bacterium]